MSSDLRSESSFPKVTINLPLRGKWYVLLESTRVKGFNAVFLDAVSDELPIEIHPERLFEKVGIAVLRSVCVRVCKTRNNEIPHENMQRLSRRVLVLLVVSVVLRYLMIFSMGVAARIQSIRRYRFKWCRLSLTTRDSAENTFKICSVKSRWSCGARIRDRHEESFVFVVKKCDLMNVSVQLLLLKLNSLEAQVIHDPPYRLESRACAE